MKRVLVVLTVVTVVFWIAYVGVAAAAAFGDPLHREIRGFFLAAAAIPMVLLTMAVLILWERDR